MNSNLDLCYDWIFQNVSFDSQNSLKNLCKGFFHPLPKKKKNKKKKIKKE